MRVTRQEFLSFGAAASAGWLLSPISTLAAQPQSDALARISRIIQDYDAQGIHRTGTAVDDASGMWLVEQARAAGAMAAQERFHLSRVDVTTCTVGGGGRTIEGLPRPRSPGCRRPRRDARLRTG